MALQAALAGVLTAGYYVRSRWAEMKALFAYRHRVAK